MQIGISAADNGDSMSMGINIANRPFVDFPATPANLQARHLVVDDMASHAKISLVGTMLADLCASLSAVVSRKQRCAFGSVSRFLRVVLAPRKFSQLRQNARMI